MRVKASAPWAVPVVLTVFLCALLTPSSAALVKQLPEFFARGVGFALLGVAVLALVMVFRALPGTNTKENPRQAEVVRRESEFRRGFAGRKGPPKRPRVEPRLESKGVVLEFTRRSAEPETATVLPQSPPRTRPDDIELVKQRLHDRAELLWRRRAG